MKPATVQGCPHVVTASGTVANLYMFPSEMPRRGVPSQAVGRTSMASASTFTVKIMAANSGTANRVIRSWYTASPAARYRQA